MTAIITAITGVFDAVGQWLQSALTAMIPIFWDSTAGTGGQLTFLGVLAVVGLAFSVVLISVAQLKQGELLENRSGNQQRSRIFTERSTTILYGVGSSDPKRPACDVA